CRACRSAIQLLTSSRFGWSVPPANHGPAPRSPSDANGAAMPSPYADILDLINIVPDGDEVAVGAVRARDLTLTKPRGSLGRLEELVEFLARWQGKAEPTLDNPMVAIFAGNHGVTDQGISAYPRE